MAKVICFEGANGCGKGYALAAVSKYLTDNAYEHVCLVEPGCGDSAINPMGAELRKLIKEGPARGAACEFLLFQAARLEMWEKEVRPLLDKDIIILIDRSIFSSLVYQFQIADYEHVPAIHRLTAEDYSIDLAVWVMPPLEIVKQRLSGRDEDIDVPGTGIGLESEYLSYQGIHHFMSALSEACFAKQHLLVDDIDIKEIVGKVTNAINAL